MQEVLYDAVYHERVSNLFNAQGGEWQFLIDQFTGARIVIDPLGFKSEWTIDTSGRPLELKQYIASTDPSVPSRADSGYHVWQFVPEPNCDCGLVRRATSPTGTRQEIVRDPATMDVLFDRMLANDSSGDVLEFAYTYDSQGRMISSTSPQGAGQPVNSGYRMDLQYVDLGPTHPLWPGGLEVTLTRQLPDGADPIIWKRYYDSSERIVKIVGPETGPNSDGYFQCFEYYPQTAGDDAGLLQRVYYDRLLTRWTEFDWDAAGRLIRGTRSSGAFYEQDWDAANQLIEIRNASHGSQQYKLELYYDDELQSSKSRYTYFADAPDPQAAQEAPDGWVEDNSWYGKGRELLASSTQLTATKHAFRTYGWDERAMLVSQVDEEGLEQRMQYDEFGATWKIWESWGTPAVHETEYEYRPDGSLAKDRVQLDDTRWVETVWDYDQFDRTIAAEVPERNRTEFDLDLEGRITAMRSIGISQGTMRQIEYETYEYDAPWVDGPTAVSRFVFDHKGLIFQRRIDSEFDYAPSGQVLEVRLEGDVYARFEYGPDGLLSAIADDEGNREEFEYDSDGRMNLQRTIAADPVAGSPSTREMSLVIDADGRTTAKVYSGAGVPTVTETFGYDSLDNIVRQTSIDGILTRTHRRYDGRATLVEYDADPAGSAPAASTEAFTWSAGGQILSATDSGGVDASGSGFSRTVHYQYDADRRLHREVQPNGQFWQWEYNRGDFPIEITTPTGRRVEFDYNDRGRVTDRRVHDVGGTLVRSDKYSWTPLGHLRRVAKTESGTTTAVLYTRDSTGRALTERVDGETVQYTHDDLGRVTKIVAPSGNERHYTYDSRHRVASIKPSPTGAPIATFDYLGSSAAVTQLTYRGGVRQRTLRDSYGRIDRMTTYASGGPALMDLAYSWNSRNLLEYEHRIHDGGGDVYGYDDLNRLSSFVRDTIDPVAEVATPGSTLANLRRDYALTPDGHRTSVVTTDSLGVATTEDYDSGPDRHHYIAIDGVTQVTDGDGRLLTDGPRTYHYDAVDQLIRVEEAGITLAEYTYDALGRQKTVTRSGTTTRYVHSGPWILEEYVSTAGGPEALEAVYTHASGVDDVVMSTRRDHADLDGDGSTSDWVDLFHHKNLVGTTQDLFLEDGTVVESYRYDAFGAPTVTDASGQVVAAPPSGNTFLFTGRLYDAATGLYDYRARTYDPSTGRFLQEDPLGYADGLNPVAYVAGNPVTSIDPYGTKGLRAAARDLMDFVKGNGPLLASIGIDLLGPLGDILDVISGAVGKDIRGFIEGGFKKLKGLSTWKRIKMAAGGAIRALGGAVNLVGKIKKAIKRAKKAIAEHRANKAAAAAAKKQSQCSPGCFVAGTAVWLACGITIPIEEICLGDMVEVSEEHSAEYGLATVEDSANPLLRLLDDDCLWVSIQGRIESGDDDVEVELLRPFEWLEQNLAETTTGEVGLWIEFPEVEIRGFVADLVLARFERPTDWSSIGSGSSMPVISILRSVSEDVGTLTVESEQIGVTGGHWIWSRTQGRWVDARRLGGCESLAVADGGSVAVEAPFVRSGSPATVWTLEVVGARTFKVGRRRLTVHNAADYGSKWPEAAPGETRVSRWMSQEEYDKMRGTGTLQEGGGGFTYVTIHGAAKPGGTGPVRADFNVPTGALDKAGRDDWKVIREPHRVPVNGLTRGN